MTVRELIERLQRLDDQDAVIVVCVSEEFGGYQEASDIELGTTDGDRFQADSYIDKWSGEPFPRRAIEIV